MNRIYHRNNKKGVLCIAMDPKDTNNNVQKERRIFLKKMTYATPALIVMGQLARPASAMASDIDDPNGPPGGSGGFGSPGGTE